MEQASEVASEGDEEDFEERDKRLENPPVYLRPLVDIANAWSTGERPSDADIAVLAPLTTAIHLKDRDLAANRTVPLGDGDVPWPAELKRLLGGVETKEVWPASRPLHAGWAQRHGALAGRLRRIAAEIGVEVV